MGKTDENSDCLKPFSDFMNEKTLNELKNREYREFKPFSSVTNDGVIGAWEKRCDEYHETYEEEMKFVLDCLRSDCQAILTRINEYMSRIYSLLDVYGPPNWHEIQEGKNNLRKVDYLLRDTMSKCIIKNEEV